MALLPPMSNDERSARQARQATALQSAALAVLLERAGGKATYTEAEYLALAERYGGTASLGVHVELSKADDGSTTVELSLIRKTPSQGSLVS